MKCKQSYYASTLTQKYSPAFKKTTVNSEGVNPRISHKTNIVGRSVQGRDLCSECINMMGLHSGDLYHYQLSAKICAERSSDGKLFYHTKAKVTF